MVLDRSKRIEALKLMALDSKTARTAVDNTRLMVGFIAEFIAESESLEGYEANAADVLDSVRDLVLNTQPTYNFKT